MLIYIHNYVNAYRYVYNLPSQHIKNLHRALGLRGVYGKPYLSQTYYSVTAIKYEIATATGGWATGGMVTGERGGLQDVLCKYCINLCMASGFNESGTAQARIGVAGLYRK